MKKRILTLFSMLCIGFAASVCAQCPVFTTSPWPNVSYNLDATPWPLELHVLGDTTGAQVQWYWYLRDSQTEADAVPFPGPGANTVSDCYPRTDASVRNTWYNYFCIVTTTACPTGVKSQTFDVQVANGSDCMTMDGTSFTIQSAPSTYDEGQTITLTAYYSGYGGFHYFTWFFNGDTLREDANHIIYNDPDNFNYSVLTIPASEVTDAGSYSVSVMDGPGCIKYTASSKTITVKPHEYLVFDDNNGTHIWSDPQNWWPNYNRIPLQTDTALIRSRCYVDIAEARVGSLTIDMTGDTALIIRPAAALVITRKLYQCKPGDLLIQADASGNGALVLAPGNNNIPATVQFYALSEQSASLAPVWQYMGYPLQDQPLISNAYPGVELYEWTNTPNLTIGGNWQKIDGDTQNAAAFSGYCMTEPAKQTYTFSGLLNNPAAKTLSVPYNDQGTYPGFAFLANSWVAPIDIARMDIADFGAADATVYIMNTGTYAQAETQQPSMSATATGTDPGQYNAVPVHAASYLPNALSVIPPMQGFFVHTAAATTLRLDYNKAVYTPALTKVNTTPTRAPQIFESSNLQIFKLHISGFGHSDQLYILLGEDFTDSFDNGWDGRKAYGRSPLSIAAVTEDGPMAVAATPLSGNLPIRIEAGLDKYYTITISSPFRGIEGVFPLQGEPEGLFLYDKEEGYYTPVADGAEYTFTYTGKADRFYIVRAPGRKDQNDKAVKYIRNNHLYIEQSGVIYDALGRKIGETK